MAKGQIIDSFGDGRYQIREIRTNINSVDAFTKLVEERTRLEFDIAELNVLIQEAFTEQENVELALNNAIDNIELGNEESFQAVRDILDLRFIVAKGLGILRSQRAQKQIRLETVNKEIELLTEQLTEDPSGFAWCADYSPSIPIGATVPLLSINRSRLPLSLSTVTIPEPQQEYIIGPARGATDSVFHSENTHGFYSIVAGDDPNGTFFNIAAIVPA